MPNKGKYGKYRKHCSSCVFCIDSAKDKYVITCMKHLTKFFCSHYCDNHIDKRSNKGKEIIRNRRNRIAI